MRIFGRQKTEKAFALPTVLIASVVLLSILAVSVTATATIRTALQNQYYVQLAQVAGEAGVAYAKACLAASGNIPQWTTSKPLTPATDCSGNVILSPTVKALVVGGGGSGGGSTGGGGGAGGLVYNTSVPVSATAYPVVVGAGGAASSQQTSGKNGVASSFNGITADGGGGGGYSVSGGSGFPGLNGGSGGGGETYLGNTVGGTATVNEGNNGSGGNAGQTNAGGGGGAGTAGNMSGAASIGGAGGSGAQNNITGSMVYYAAGGGGGNGGPGGNSIGGTGAKNGSAGAANTGSGGGGGWDYSGGTGGAGGTGVVIISYPIDSGITATGTLTAGGTTVTPTTSGGNKIFKFTGSGTFTVTSTGAASCPSDSRCSVTVNGNVRSSFAVPKPTVDPATGRALTILNNGYTEITRASNGAVWRRYNQPSVQPAVVPDLCSGNANSARGWGQATVATQQDSLASASSAQSITLTPGPINAGTIYFRKDFNISTNASYDFNIYTPSSSNAATVYLDGVPFTSTAGSLASASTTLTTGCHVLVVKLTNQTYLPQAATFTASLTRSGAAAPIFVSDTSWRVTSGDPVHYSMSNYQETPGAWEPVTVAGIWSDPATPWATNPTDWLSSTKDGLTEWITTTYSSGSGFSRPFNQYAWFRQSQPFTTTSTSSVQVSAICDNNCDVYLDGNLVFNADYTEGTVDKKISIQPGTHTFGVRLYNAGSANNAAGFMMTAYDTGANQVIARSNADWDGTTSWSSTAADIYSYDTNYSPVPAVLPAANVKVLAVGGGGGGGSGMGGGGGGGGVVYDAAHKLTLGTYAVVVGGGGVGAPAGLGQVRGANGGNSTFDTLRAYGGGGGGSYYNTNASPPGAGASAGGSAGANQTLRAAGIIGQGYDSTATLGSYYPTGGGGAGSVGFVNPANGGYGIQNAILGTNYYWGGGGGGSGYTTIGGNGGPGGGGGGAIGVTTGGSGLNNGSPGGGGALVSQANTPGGNGAPVTGGGGGGGGHYNANNYGGTGGTGMVAVSIPTGSMSVSVSGSYVNYSSSTPGFTTYLFYGAGTLTVNSIAGTFTP